MSGECSGPDTAIRSASESTELAAVPGCATVGQLTASTVPACTTGCTSLSSGQRLTALQQVPTCLSVGRETRSFLCRPILQESPDTSREATVTITELKVRHVPGQSSLLIWTEWSQLAVMMASTCVMD